MRKNSTLFAHGTEVYVCFLRAGNARLQQELFSPVRARSIGLAMLIEEEQCKHGTHYNRKHRSFSGQA